MDIKKFDDKYEQRSQSVAASSGEGGSTFYSIIMPLAGSLRVLNVKQKVLKVVQAVMFACALQCVIHVRHNSLFITNIYNKN